MSARLRNRDAQFGELSDHEGDMRTKSKRMSRQDSGRRGPDDKRENHHYCNHTSHNEIHRHRFVLLLIDRFELFWRDGQLSWVPRHRAITSPQRYGTRLRRATTRDLMYLVG